MPAQIPFTRGVPSADILPVTELREAASAALEREPALALSYSSGAGHPGLRSWIAGRHRVEAARVVCTNGSLQALLFVAEVLLRGASNRRVLVEAPTYDRAIIVLRRAGAEVGAVCADEQGLNVDALEERIERDGAPALLYVIPNFQNPSGVTLPLERRQRLVALAREHGFRILEDDPYGLLRWSGERVPSLFELDGGENVVALSSFTKTVAPGIRVGYAIAPEGVAADLTKHANDTYIAPSMLSQSTLHAYVDAGHFDPGVQRATAALRERCTAMAESLREHFPSATRFVVPEGGYFIWVDLPEGADTGHLLVEATEAGVPYVKGADFFAEGGGTSSLRLAFSAVAPDPIREGIARLGAIVARAPATA
jgi:DNA-binding transcriptional MocR family regulator